MKRVYLIVLTTLLLGVTCSASSISPGPGCPGQSCPLEPVETVRSSALVSSTSLASLASPSVTNLTPTLTTASNLLSQTAAAPPATANSFLEINPIAADFTAKTKDMSPTAEPPTLLLLSGGLLFLPLLRKRRAAKRALHVRLA